MANKNWRIENGVLKTDKTSIYSGSEPYSNCKAINVEVNGRRISSYRVLAWYLINGTLPSGNVKVKNKASGFTKENMCLYADIRGKKKAYNNDILRWRCDQDIYCPRAIRTSVTTTQDLSPGKPLQQYYAPLVEGKYLTSTNKIAYYLLFGIVPERSKAALINPELGFFRANFKYQPDVIYSPVELLLKVFGETQKDNPTILDMYIKQREEHDLTPPQSEHDIFAKLMRGF